LRKYHVNYLLDLLIIFIAPIISFLVGSINIFIISTSSLLYIPFILLVIYTAIFFSILKIVGFSKYSSFEDSLTSTLALTTTYLILVILNSIFDVWQYFLIYYLFAYVLTIFALILIRTYHRSKLTLRRRFFLKGKGTIIYGAGSLGKLLSEQILSDPNSRIKILGFVDDNPNLKSYLISKFKVLGAFSQIKDLSQKLDIELVLVAIKNIEKEKLDYAYNICQELGITVKLIPSLKLMIDTNIKYHDMRDVEFSDILGRKNISFTDLEIKTLFKDKKVLVTGAGGSIGSEIVRQLHNYSPEIVGCLDRDESALHALELSLFGSGLLLSESMILADLRDQEAIDKVIEKFRPDIVFHAGALKHVVMLEKYPEEAFKTNVLGTKNLVQSCLKHGVELFLNISTDKAARPISVLGNTKLHAEKIVTDANLEISSNKKYMSVRFGNVLGSRGSFLDTFRFQIEKGLPITITDKNVQRYFMTVEEAVFLVLQSAAIGPKGSVLFLDMGNPVRIEDVAKKLISQSGKDIEIKYSGLRKGEKMDEVLFDTDSQVCELIQPGIFQIKDKTK
jgi:FlaA1/EpsC-like NDP-sugar epimerase